VLAALAIALAIGEARVALDDKLVLVNRSADGRNRFSRGMEDGEKIRGRQVEIAERYGAAREGIDNGIEVQADERGTGTRAAEDREPRNGPSTAWSE